jgi:diaminopimelate epimerase
MVRVRADDGVRDGACATLVAAFVRGLTRRSAMVTLPGGALTIEWSENDGHVYMTGPAETAFTGEWPDA